MKSVVSEKILKQIARKFPIYDFHVWPAFPCPCRLCNQSTATTCFFIWNVKLDEPGGVYCAKHGFIAISDKTAKKL